MITLFILDPGPHNDCYGRLMVEKDTLVGIELGLPIGEIIANPCEEMCGMRSRDEPIHVCHNCKAFNLYLERTRIVAKLLP